MPFPECKLNELAFKKRHFNSITSYEEPEVNHK
jgi:hypothetical protein